MNTSNDESPKAFFRFCAGVFIGAGFGGLLWFASQVSWEVGAMVTGSIAAVFGFVCVGYKEEKADRIMTSAIRFFGRIL